MSRAVTDLAFQVQQTLEDCLNNIISDTVLKAHREEKLLRMQSAAVIAQQYKEQAAGEASEGEDVLPVTAPGASIERDAKPTSMAILS